MTSTPTATVSQPPAHQIEANRAIAIEFLRRASAGHARDVMRRYAAPDFVHHNPYFSSDADTLATAMDESARANPDKTLDIQRAIAEGPFVALHSRVQLKPGEAPVAVVHIFRVEDGRIHELWDVAQPAPDDSPNRVGMF
jgi:predicted SnoaL-like aldol condensation-catalyzing enzyme